MNIFFKNGELIQNDTVIFNQSGILTTSEVRLDNGGIVSNKDGDTLMDEDGNVYLKEDGNLFVGGTSINILQKQYVDGVAYTNGTPILACADVGSSFPRGIFIPYQTQDGAWRLRTNFVLKSFTAGNNPVVTISGIVSKNITDFYQTGVSNVGEDLFTLGGDTRNNAVIDPNTNSITISTANVLSDNASVFMDIELDEKPTWAD